MNNPFEEIEIIDNKNLLTRIDEFEEKIKIIDLYTKEYEKLKKEIKEEMLKTGKKINVEQLKWTTPNGIKITCSIGKKPIFKKVKEKRFSETKLANEYPDIYKKCIVERETNEMIEKGSNDRLVITLPKE